MLDILLLSCQAIAVANAQLRPLTRLRSNRFVPTQASLGKDDPLQRQQKIRILPSKNSNHNGSVEAEQEDELLHVFVGYKSQVGRKSLQAMINVTHKHDFAEVHAMALVIPRSKLNDLAVDPEIMYVETDDILQPDYLIGTHGEVTPYGIVLSQNFDQAVTLDFETSSTASKSSIRRKQQTRNQSNLQSSTSPIGCNNKKSFRVAIIDSGYSVGHPDLACQSRNDPHCVGAEFGLTNNSWKWYNPIQNIHGTHVAGTIGAIGGNGKGVVGMVPDNDICYVIGRVFGESGGAFTSDILNAIRWAVTEQHANVVNLSLSGMAYDETSDNFFSWIYSTNHLVVASSGNTGKNEYRFPAAFATVVSVSAVDAQSNIATFSTTNDRVDLCGPGM